MRLRVTKLNAIGNRRSGNAATLAWTPAALGSALALWLDAADAGTITLNGSTVSQWRDKSSNNRHASQATAANQPTYIASGLNGKPLLDWDGSDDSMTISGGTVPLHTALSNNDNHSVTMLVLPDVISNFPVFLHVPNLGSWRFLLESNDQGFFWGYTSGVLRNYGINFFTENTPSFFTANKTGATTGDAYSNGVLQSSFLGNFGATPSLTSPFLLGSYSNPSVNYDGKFAEIIITNTALSNADRQLIEGYLAWKWALVANLPVGHPFKFAPPFV